MSSDEVVTALGKMTDSIILLCEGQALDVSFPQAMDVTEKDYLFMIGGKTSSLRGTPGWRSRSSMISSASPRTRQNLASQLEAISVRERRPSS